MTVLLVPEVLIDQAALQQIRVRADVDDAPLVHHQVPLTASAAIHHQADSVAGMHIAAHSAGDSYCTGYLRRVEYIVRRDRVQRAGHAQAR